MNDKRAAMV